MKLLIVDDSNIIRKAIQKYLAEFGLEIVGEAGDGRTALTLFRETSPDVVTMDITMPEMDGLETLSEMRKISDSPKIIIVTALKDKATALDALQKGASGFLAKPFTEAQLKEEIGRAIGRAS
ncbi:MAG TPA: response regulator [Leptospiraceae bacterium]|nr:response regulator [Leptospiraceae bacterium]HMX57560.1 response regulator [Leptospiraceae bacterium]HMY45207.1 response regulator [Leptospiraceae bacterium]HMZ37648.1 response regulator [Leptospiraceae bacterium]HNE24353.1 response regulator [Leptospiraceae bacterium]